MNEIRHMHDNRLRAFLAQARKFPMLSADEEREFVARWRENGDKAALNRLLGSHLRLVIKMAYGNTGYGLPVDDLIAEGNAGLMKAVEHFDPDRGFRFATYAQWWIRAEIQTYILRNWSIVRMGTTAAQKKLFFNLRRLKSSLNAYEDGDLSPEFTAKIATELDVSENEVTEMNRRLAGGESSLNAVLGEDGESTHQDFLRDDRPDQEAAYAEAEEFGKRWTLVERALEKLTPRERDILTERKLGEVPKTLEELSIVYGVSRERIRQIEAGALEKLKRTVRATAGEHGLIDVLGSSEEAFRAAA